MSLIERIEKLTYRVANPIVKMILRSPLHKIASASVALLHFRGRKSGRAFVTPLSYVRDSDNIWLLSAHTTRWWMNLRDNHTPVSLEVARKTYTGKAQLWERDSDELRDRAYGVICARFHATPRSMASSLMKTERPSRKVSPQLPRSLSSLKFVSTKAPPRKGA